MKCYYHENREAVAYCSVCGKALCQECAGAYNEPLCGDCARNEVDAARKSIIMKLGGGAAAAIFLICTFFLPEVSTAPASGILALLFGAVVLTLECMTIPFGWSALNRITPNVFLVLPVFGWVLYYSIKLTISFYAGWVATPVAIYKYIKLKNTVALVESDRTLALR